MNKEITDKKFWEKYWGSKTIFQIVEENYSFSNIFKEELTDKNYKSMVEIGGFPGYFAIYFRKYWGYKTTLLDYIINHQIVEKLLKINKLKPGDIELAKTDFTKYEGSKKYDVVFSLGFIEHFEDTADIIKRHWKMVNPGGKMIIGIPNFLGINGIYQLLFDPAILNVHNLNSMDSVRLKAILKNSGIKNFKVFYVSGAMVWLESLNKRKPILRFFTRILNFIGLGLTRLGIKGKFVSTHIFIVAEK